MDSHVVSKPPDGTGADAPALQPTDEPATRRKRPGFRWTFVLPAVAVYVFIMIVPSLRGVVYSFTDWDGLSRSFNFVGLENYRLLFSDPAAVGAILHTVGFALAITIIQTALGLGLALALNTAVKARGMYRALFFAPVVVMPIVTAYLWKFIFGASGPVNQALEAIGAGDLSQPWLGQPTTAFWVIVIVAVWQFAGVTMAIFLAGLQSIPAEVLEASSIDGAGSWQRFRLIVFPLLRPALTVNILLTLIGALKLFDQVWVVTQGGPAFSTDTLATALYRTTFLVGDFAYGTTLAVALTVIVIIFSAVQYGVLNRRRG